MPLTSEQLAELAYGTLIAFEKRYEGHKHLDANKALNPALPKAHLAEVYSKMALAAFEHQCRVLEVDPMSTVVQELTVKMLESQLADMNAPPPEIPPSSEMPPALSEGLPVESSSTTGQPAPLASASTAPPPGAGGTATPVPGHEGHLCGECSNGLHICGPGCLSSADP